MRGTIFYRQICVKYTLLPFDLERPSFDTVTRGKRCVSRESDSTPVLRGWPRHLSPKMEPILHTPHGMPNSNQILHGEQARCRENVYTVDHAAWSGKKFCTRMLTRDRFAVANLLVDWLNCDVMFATHYRWRRRQWQSACHASQWRTSTSRHLSCRLWKRCD